MSRYDRSLRFLVVDDDDEMRRFLAATLRVLGFKIVRQVREGQEGIDLLKQLPMDFVLSDWEMPGMDGMALLREMRAEPMWDLVPFLLLSANINAEVAAEAEDYGADGHLLKPIRQDVLMSAIQRIVEYRDVFTEIYILTSRAKALADASVREDAYEEIRKAQMKYPGNPMVWNESGLVLSILGEQEMAEWCHKRAIELNRRFLKAYDSLGALYFNQRRFSDARLILEKAVLLSPRNKFRHREIGKACLAEGFVEKARSWFYEAVALEGNSGARHAAVGEIFFELERADLAEHDFSQACQTDPGMIHYYNRLGIALRRQGKLKEAAQNYKRAINIAPGDPIVYYNYAIALSELKDIPQAKASLQRSLALDPGFNEAQALLDRLSHS